MFRSQRIYAYFLIIIEMDDQPAKQRTVCVHEKKMENLLSFLLFAIVQIHNMVLLYTRGLKAKLLRGPNEDL